MIRRVLVNGSYTGIDAHLINGDLDAVTTEIVITTFGTFHRIENEWVWIGSTDNSKITLEETDKQ